MAWDRAGHITSLEQRLREITESIDQIRKELEPLEKIRGDLGGLVEALKGIEDEVKGREK